MEWQIWTAYAAASTALLLLPGPTVLLVVGYALSSGKRSAWTTIPAVALGDVVAVTLSLAGLGTVLATSATLFVVLKWLGAAYLVYLGVKLWRADPVLDETAEAAPAKGWSVAGHAFAVTALNPKSIAFFVAFLPQFIDPAAAALPQFLILGVTFVLLAAIIVTGYAMVAGSVRDRLRRPELMRLVNRLGGSLLIGAGIMMAALRRSN